MNPEYARLYKDETEYKKALTRLNELACKNELLPDERDEVELIALLIDQYEHNKYRISPPKPAEAIKFRMDQLNLRPIDLVPFIGSRGRVSEILSGKRQLTIKMIKSLHVGLNIPVEALLAVTDDDRANKRKYKIGDWVEFRNAFGDTQQAKITNIHQRHCSLRMVNGKRLGVLWGSVIHKISPQEIIVTIGCLSGRVEPVSINGIHLWFHLIGVDDKIIATIRISCLDKETRKLVEGLLEAQEEKCHS